MAAKLSKKEKKTANDFAVGKYKKTKDRGDLRKIALATKESRINLRLQAEVLAFFQREAERQGIAYQTLINSTLYKVANGELVERRDSNVLDEIKKLSKKLDKLG